MLKVAITGSIASGKSTVLQFFHDFGAYVLSADALLREVYTPDTLVGKKIIALFGDQIVHDNQIDRVVLSDIVHFKPEMIHDLEKICHPYVEEMIKKQYMYQNRVDPNRLFVVEIPLFFESPYISRNWYDRVILVVTEDDKAQKRFYEKGSLKQFTFLKQRQKSQNMKDCVDFVIENNSDKRSLKEKTKKIFHTLKQSITH